MQGQEKALLGFGKTIRGQLNPWGLFVRVRWQQRTLAAPGDSTLHPGLPPGRDLQRQGTACPVAAHGHACLDYSTSQHEGRPRAESHYVKKHAGGQTWQEPPRASVGLAHIWANAEVAVGFGETLWWVCGDRLSGEREEADSSGTSAVWRW